MLIAAVQMMFTIERKVTDKIFIYLSIEKAMRSKALVRKKH